jgi:succinoglycan biosynthesis transport protein ExoP
MPQVVDNRSVDGKGLQHYLEIITRRRLLFLVPFFLGWLAVWTASWILPPKFKSGTLILVEQPTMPKDYVMPNISENLQERLQSITQQILSRSRLLHIADELSLYPKERTRLSPDEIVAHMRKNIDIELVRGVDNRISAFNIYYTAGDPHIAQQVTSKLTSLFINENLEIRQEESEGNTRFLENQLESASQSLAEQERKIREFKAQYVGQLPSQLNSNLQILGGLQSQLQAESEALNTTKQQRVYLETLLGQYKALSGGSKDKDVPLTGLADADDRLDKLQTHLLELSSTYGDKYPEVRKVKDQIAKTEAERDRLLANQKANGNKESSDVSSPASAYTERGPRDPSTVAQLQSQLKANQIEIKDRERQIATLSAKIGEYQARLNQEPIREQQLSDLTRGYDQSKASYDTLLKKKDDSAMATRMERLQQGERFRIIDPPSLPLKPTFPNRLKLCGIGLFVGLVLGAGAMAAAEMMDDRIYSELELRKLLPVPVLSELPIIHDPADEQSKKRTEWINWAATAAVVATILAGTAASYFKG